MTNRCCLLTPPPMLHSPCIPCASWTATSFEKFFVTPSSDSLSSHLFSSFPSLCVSWSCLFVTPAPARKSPHSSCASSPASWSSLSPWPYSSVFFSASAACPWTAKSSRSPPSASAASVSSYPLVFLPSSAPASPC